MYSLHAQLLLNNLTLLASLRQSDLIGASAVSFPHSSALHWGATPNKNLNKNINAPCKHVKSHGSWAEIKDHRNVPYAQKAYFSKMLCTYLFTSLFVSISLPDRCGISRRWLNSILITQVHLVLGTIKGQSTMCSFVTQHNATEVSSFEGACNWHADCRNVHQSCCQRMLPHVWHCVGEQVCWCKHCEQCATWWRWGYGMGRQA
jgi:hypothetical protein